MESKYYTPEIEEFHVGFEYEFNKNNNWIKHQIGKPRIFALDDFNNLFLNISNDNWGNYVRVKYLDKEDIESLGFEEIKQSNTNNFTFKSTNDNFLQLNISYGEPCKVSIFHYEGWDTPIILLKNKSELKKLLKQLNVG